MTRGGRGNLTHIREGHEFTWVECSKERDMKRHRVTREKKLEKEG